MAEKRLQGQPHSALTVLSVLCLLCLFVARFF